LHILIVLHDFIIINYDAILLAFQIILRVSLLFKLFSYFRSLKYD